jgi:hypothetical protein
MFLLAHFQVTHSNHRRRCQTSQPSSVPRAINRTHCLSHFRLPAEVRNMIFDYTLTAEPVHLRCQPFSPVREACRCGTLIKNRQILWLLLATRRRVDLETHRTPLILNAHCLKVYRCHYELRGGDRQHCIMIATSLRSIGQVDF